MTRRPRLEAAIQRIGNDLDRRVERNAVARDGVVDLPVGTGGVEGALQIGDPRNRRYSAVGDSLTPVSRSPTWIPARWPGLSGRTFSACRPPGRFAPPDAVVRLWILALLEDIQHRQHEQRSCGQGQQRSLHAVKEACLHEREFSTSIALQARRLPCSGDAALRQRCQANRLRTIVIWTFERLEMSTRSEVDHNAGAKNKSEHPREPNLPMKNCR